MTLATKDPDSDEKLNPAAWDESTGSRMSAAEDSAAFDDMMSPENYARTADDSSENANIEKARAGEERGAQPSPEEKTRKGKHNEARDNIGNKKDKLALNLMKKKGPLALIGLLLGGGGGLFAALLSPGLAIVQLKESLVNDLSDSVSAMDERAQHIFRSKTRGQVSKLCNSKVTIKCKYSTMSERQVKKLAAAGITIKEDLDKRPLLSGRHRVQAFVFTDIDGSRTTVTPDNFKKLYRENAHFRSLMNKYYSPRWMAVRDNIGKSVMAKFRLATHRNIGGKDKAQMNDQTNKTVREGAQGVDNRRAIVAWDETTGKQVYLNPDDLDGGAVTNIAGEEMIPDEAEKQLREFRKMTSGGMNTALQGIRASSWIASGTQTVCTWNYLVRTAGTLIRNAKYVQYMRYAMVFNNTADSIILGTATPEAIEFVGDILTKKDMRDKVLSEASVPTETESDGKIVFSSIADSATPTVKNNPHKGTDAFDHPAVKAAMYGGGGALDMRSSLTSFGTGLGNVFSRFIGDIIGELEPQQSVCDFWRSPAGITAGIGLGVASLAISAAGTGGTGGAGAPVLMAQVSKAVAMTAAFMIASHMLQTRIMSVLEGNSIDADNSYGFDSGGAYFAGTAAFTASSSSARGLRPLSTLDEVRENNRVAFEEQQRYSEVARIEAADTPFDIYNQHSFIGSIAWNLAPSARKSSNTVATMVMSPLQLLAKTPNWLMPGAHASTPVMSEKRYTEGCKDEEIFKKENLNVEAPDMMCNLRFGMSEEQRNADPEKVVQWMIDSCQIDPITGDVNETGKCPEGCEPGNTTGGETCYRTTNPDEANAMLNSSTEQIASAMRYDDEGIDRPIASKDTIAAEQTAVIDQLPLETQQAQPYSDNPEDAKKEVTKDVRTYAHFLRYCRNGAENGRQVNFGDPDSDEEITNTDGTTSGGEANSGILKSLGLEEKYRSYGKECFSSNNCDPSRLDPNKDGILSSSDDGMKFCRPPQYDMYEVYTVDRHVEEGPDQEDEEEAQQSASGNSTGEFDWPMAETPHQVISSCYGPRWGSMHGALDIAASGTPDILAADGGKVTMVRNGNGDPGMGGFGETVVIEHSNGFYTRYSHMTSGSITVKEGDTVDKGQKIGAQGNTGQSTGPHLDFGVSREPTPYNNNSENPMNHLEVPSWVSNQAGCAAD